MCHNEEFFIKLLGEMHDYPVETQEIMVWIIKNIKSINEAVKLLPITLEEAQKLYNIAIERDNQILMLLAKAKIGQAGFENR